MKVLFCVAAFLLGTDIAVFSQYPIDTSRVVTVGGIKQFITVNGRDRSKPLLLFLHGGPGNSVMGYSQKFTRKLQEHFTVIQWDQRESGKTKDLNRSEGPLIPALFEDDTRELIAYLLKDFHQEKLYLVGHSWGTYLGFRIAARHPEWLYAYVAVGPMIDQLESERTILQKMKDKAREDGNRLEIEELSRVQIPFQTGEQLYFHRHWLLNYMGSKKSLDKNFVLEWSKTWLDVFTKASSSNLFVDLPEVKCPVYFFAGRNDFQTNAEIAERYYQKVVAPKKDFFWFERSGHSIPTSEPETFQDIIINHILPKTFIDPAKPQIATQE